MTLDRGVEAPALGARRRVEREHAPERRRQHEQAVHQDGRGLEGHVVGRAGVGVEIAGADLPGDLELSRRSLRSISASGEKRWPPASPA